MSRGKLPLSRTITQFRFTILFTSLFTSLLFVASFAFAATPTYEAAPTSSEVLVVYNSSYTTDANTNGTQDSLEIAQYYQTKRSIPGQLIYIF